MVDRKAINAKANQQHSATAEYQILKQPLAVEALQKFQLQLFMPV